MLVRNNAFTFSYITNSLSVEKENTSRKKAAAQRKGISLKCRSNLMSHSRNQSQFFFIFVFYTQLTVSKCLIKTINSNRSPLVYEATALPTKPILLIRSEQQLKYPSI